MAIVLDPHTAQHLETFQTLTSIEQSIVTQALQQITSTAAVDPTADALAESIAGKTFTRQERIQLEMDTLARHFQHRRQLLDRLLSASQVAQLLGTSRQTPHDRQPFRLSAHLTIFLVSLAKPLYWSSITLFVLCIKINVLFYILFNSLTASFLVFLKVSR